MEAHAAALVVGLMTLGVALIFWLADRRVGTSRALALCLAAVGAAVLIDPLRALFDVEWRCLAAFGNSLLESLAILAGIEWGRRIGLTARRGGARAASVLFRIAQLLVLIYFGLQLGYLWLAPERATEDVSGLIRVRAFEFALFAPVLGAAMLLSLIAIVILLFARTDAAESIRLRALLFAAPFLLAGLIVSQAMVPIVLTVGLLIFLAGAVRYLLVQTRRGQFMSRFLSPQVATALRGDGEALLRRERREISIVFCDLRGFTAYARDRDSDTVMDLLEAFYATVGATAKAHRGSMVKDHAGDGVLLLVGAPVAVDGHARIAIELALDLRARGRALLQARQAPLGLGIGVATGPATLGAIQGAGRLEYAAVGAAVNLAARLCQRAEDGEVLIDAATQAQLDAPAAALASPRPAEPFKGYESAVPVFALSDASGVALAGTAEASSKEA